MLELLISPCCLEVVRESPYPVMLLSSARRGLEEDKLRLGCVPLFLIFGLGGRALLL